MGLVRAVDVSNYTGELSAEAVASLLGAGVGHLVVRLSLEDAERRAIAVQQLRAGKAGGMSLSGYAWVYWDWEPVATVDGALGVAAEGGVRLRTLWLDVEAPPPGETPPAGEMIAWLRIAIARAREVGQRVGVYTGAWWWRPATRDSRACRDVPLWYADYDGVPALAGWTPFGGWSAPAGKQYAGSVAVGGVGSADLSVFRPGVTVLRRRNRVG